MIISDLNAQKYFVGFTDKADNDFSIIAPEEYLSQRAIGRRARQNIEITEEDLPVNQSYLDSLSKMDLKILWPSKWLNGAIIESDNSVLMDTITRVSFISSSRLIWKSTTNTTIQKFPSQNTDESLKADILSIYGESYNQTVTINGHLLHQEGYAGDGMLIAVIDNGFGHVDELPMFNHLWSNNKIKASVDFVNQGNNVFDSEYYHGMYVLSVLSGFIESEYKGSAPDANYILLRTEDDNSEYPIEEYNWVIAAEYADSAGVDVINSSLGYSQFDDTSFNYSYSDMDGKTTICVLGAEKAFSKGILVVNSAGNEGNSSWKYIISPADGENVLAVAAMNTDSTRASFSSYGPSFDDRIKPDIAALGVQNSVQDITGYVTHKNGTSFSAPVISGFASCLWQAKPTISNNELLQIIKLSSHHYYNPDDSFGYGIPNFYTALDIDSSTNETKLGNTYIISPNPFSDKIEIINGLKNIIKTQIKIFDLTGKQIVNKLVTSTNTYTINNLENLPSGLYILQLIESSQKYSFKILKK